MGQVSIKPAAQVAEEKQKATKRALESAVQRHMDETARERGYDNIMSLCTYATSSKAKFAAEGQAGVEWRDDVWAHCYTELEKAEAGGRSVPTVDELIAELPPFTWPE